MADEPLNIQPESGDILGSFSFGRKKESSDKSFKTMEDSLSNIAKGIDGLHSDFVKFVADNKTSNAATAARNFESASSKQRSSSFRSSTSSSKGSFDDVFDGFEESLADHLGVPSPDQMKNAVSKALDVYAGSLASIMGVDENDLAKEFTKKLSSAAFKGFDAKHPKIAQQVKIVSDWYSSGVEKAFTSISESIYQNIDVPDSLKQKVTAARTAAAAFLPLSRYFRLFCFFIQLLFMTVFLPVCSFKEIKKVVYEIGVYLHHEREQET